MAWFFRKKQRANAAAPQYAPGTQLAYDPELIGRFKGHHQSLLKLFNDINTAAGGREYKQLEETLGRFKRVLQAHLLEENVKMYAYMQACLNRDPQNARLMRDMKSEMTGIGNSVNRFITRYTRTTIDSGNVQSFQQELQEIGAILVDRIKREEDTLYPLYMHPQQYQ